MIVIGSLSSSSAKGRGSPFESKAASESINLLLPSPGSPCNRVTLPNGIYGYHSHFTSFGSISLAFTISSGTFTFISFSIIFTIYCSPFLLKIKTTSKIHQALFVSFLGAKIWVNIPFQAFEKTYKVFVLTCGYVLNCGFWVTKNTVLLRCFPVIHILFLILTNWWLSLPFK